MHRQARVFVLFVPVGVSGGGLLEGLGILLVGIFGVFGCVVVLLLALPQVDFTEIFTVLLGVGLG